MLKNECKEKDCVCVCVCVCVCEEREKGGRDAPREGRVKNSRTRI